MRAVLIVASLALSACKQPAISSGTAATDVNTSSSSQAVSLLVQGDGSIKASPTATHKITKIDSVNANVVMDSTIASTVSADMTVGSLKITSVAYQLDGSEGCVQSYTQGVASPRCTAAAVATNTAENSVESVSPKSLALTQSATPLDGMVCGAHGSYPTKVWQKQFRVALTGSAADLDQVKEARYTVWYSYGKTYVGANRDDNFDAGASFLTPVTSWSIDEASVVTKSGQTITIPKTTVVWTDSDPAKKAATPCE